MASRIHPAVRTIGPARTALAGLAAAIFVLAGCATPPDDPEGRIAFEEANDPLEPLNRGVFEFNRVLDGVLLKPAALVYRGVLPGEVRDRLRNVLDNLDNPVIAGNKLLQGEVEASLRAFWRFAFNSTVGLAGIFDVATDMGLPVQDADFGQTLYVWGIEDGGPYLMLPVFGPSNVRDAVGIGVDSFADPVSLVLAAENVEWANYVRAGVDGVDKRSRAIEVLDNLERQSLDFYAQVRSIYRQRRAAELAGRAAGPSSQPGATYIVPSVMPGVAPR